MLATILVVDSSPFTRYATVQALERALYDVREAASARHAEQVVRAANPDLILLDVHLADASGFDFCGALKSKRLTPSTVIVMRAGDRKSTEDRQRALSVGADEYLEGPLSPERLIETVRRLLG